MRVPLLRTKDELSASRAALFPLFCWRLPYLAVLRGSFWLVVLEEREKKKTFLFFQKSRSVVAIKCMTNNDFVFDAKR